jgi:hypothetical protein
MLALGSLYTILMHTLVLFVFLLLSSAVVSVYSAVVGGGGIILFPLLTLLGVPIPVGIATLRVTAVVQQSTAVLAFFKEGYVRWKPGLWIGLWSIPGTIAGANLVLSLDNKVLSYIVAILMLILLVGAFLIDKKKLKGKPGRPKRAWKQLALIGLVSGFYGGFYGLGYSTILMMIFIVVGGYSFMVASAEASVATLVMSCTASAYFIHSGQIDWWIFTPIAIGGVVGSWFGVEWAAKFGLWWVKMLLLIVVLASVVKLLTSS